MNEEIKSTTNLGDFEDCIRAFRDCMEPALHLMRITQAFIAAALNGGKSDNKEGA